MRILFLLLVLTFLSCTGSDPSVLGLQLRLIPLQGRSPLYNTAGTDLPRPWKDQKLVLESYGFNAFARLVYTYGASDTVAITILEFRDDMSALGFQLNGGYTREGLPVVKGEWQERSIRAGRRLFIFASPAIRPLPAEHAEQFVKVFPGYRAGLPQEFLALPIKNRQPGGTSMQIRSFLGIESSFSMLAQSYDDGVGRWYCARSWEPVSAGAWKAYMEQLRKKRSYRSLDIGTVACDGSSCAWIDRLPDGRIVAAYGDLDFSRLAQVFLAARRALDESAK